MNPIAKTIIVLGIALVVVGVIWQLGSGIGLSFGKLPGDISVEKPGFKFYFPLTTCLLISGIVSLAMWIYRHFSR